MRLKRHAPVRDFLNKAPHDLVLANRVQVVQFNQEISYFLKLRVKALFSLFEGSIGPKPLQTIQTLLERDGLSINLEGLGSFEESNRNLRSWTLTLVLFEMLRMKRYQRPED